LPTGAIIVIVSGERRTMLDREGCQRLTPMPCPTDCPPEYVPHFTGYSVFSRLNAALRGLHW
jgi:hypothetical protein